MCPLAWFVIGPARTSTCATSEPVEAISMRSRVSVFMFLPFAFVNSRNGAQCSNFECCQNLLPHHLLHHVPVHIRQAEIPAVVAVGELLVVEAAVCCWFHKSSGFRPVRLATRASIFGPISSPWWNANTTSGQPERSRILCEPSLCRLIRQPIRSRVAKTRLAFFDPHWLMRPQRRPGPTPAPSPHAPTCRRGHAGLEL